MCKPPKSGASRVWITFLQLTQKILTKDIFHWLQLITEILSFLQIFSVRKNYISGIFWVFKSKLQINHAATYVALFLFLFLSDSNNCFFICLVAYIPFCLYYFAVLYFHFLFHSLLAKRHILQFTMFDSISLQPFRNISGIKNTL